MDASKALVLIALALLAVGCQEDDVSSGLPAPVAETRSQILDAAESGDYDQLPPLLNDETLAAWRRQGRKPLETMAVVLRMPHQLRETNEGTLYQWPRYGPNSKPGDIAESDRELFRQVMTEAEVANLILPEYGYVNPRLGILADGRWWFFVLEGGP
jgi:hypothetical protein